jgi:hypothetical protein
MESPTTELHEEIAMLKRSYTLLLEKYHHQLKVLEAMRNALNNELDG